MKTARRRRLLLGLGVFVALLGAYAVVPKALIDRTPMHEACAGEHGPGASFFASVRRLELLGALPGHGADAASQIGLGVSRCSGVHAARCTTLHFAATDRAQASCVAKLGDAHRRECADRARQARRTSRFIAEFGERRPSDRSFCNQWRDFQALVEQEPCSICALP